MFLMVSPFRVHHALYQASKVIQDPGASGTITVIQDLQVCELVTLTAESRTLTVPTKPGIRFTLRMKTDGGDATVTTANGWNVTGNTIATFADVGDQLDLISVTHTTGYRWEILTNTGSVSMS
jgi:hypothetical protein